MSNFVAVLPNTNGELSSFTLAATPTSIKRQPKVPTRIEIDTWHIKVDPFTGGLRELRNAISGYDWVDTDHEYCFGQFVHESVIHPFGREAVGNLARYLALDMASDSARDRLRFLFEPSGLKSRTAADFSNRATTCNVFKHTTLCRMQHISPLMRIICYGNRLMRR